MKVYVSIDFEKKRLDRASYEEDIKISITRELIEKAVEQCHDIIPISVDERPATNTIRASAILHFFTPQEIRENEELLQKLSSNLFI